MKKLLALLLAVVMVCTVLAGCNSTEEQEKLTGNAGEYTYNTAWSVFPTLWNPHTYETATSGDIMAYLEDGFYTFDYNDDMTGFQMVPSMTIDDHPVDITANYVGQWGIEEGDTNLVYKINLRNDLYWETGEKITAHDYVESAKRLLNPVAQNYRADTLYTGDVVIYGAESYVKQGLPAKEANSADAETMKYNFADLVKGDDGVYTTADGVKVYFALKTKLAWLGGRTLEQYKSYMGTAYDNLLALADDSGYVPVTDDTIAELYAFTGSAVWGYESQDDLGFYLVYDYNWPEYSWDNVGIFALSDTELVYVLTSPMEGFYLKYGLPSGYLVHTKTYDACEKIEDGVYTNSYGTSAATTVSYGPYKLVEYITDKVFKFEKNTYYFDHSETTYQTTHIEIQKVDEAATRLQMLIKGQLDAYGLQKDDFETYSKSDYCYYSKGASTYAMVFNPTTDAGCQMLNVKEFRQAMAYGMNRAEFILATSPAGTPAFGLFSDLHIVDPETGVGYRTTELAKQVLADFWGVADDIGAGKTYATLDDAVNALTGYSPDLAKQKFDEAYDKAIAEGVITETDKVKIIIGLPSTSATYTNGYEFIVNNYTELVKGTKLEGKLEFAKDDTIADNFAGSLQSNQVDMLFYVGWSGMELNPYGLMQAYVDPNYIYDSHNDFSQIDLTIELNGVEYTTDMYSWYKIMNGVKLPIYAADGTSIEFSCGTADGDTETRLLILGEMEGAVLQNYNFIPLSGAASAALKGAQLKYYTENYIYGMGFGGIKYMTYHYDDAEWADYVNGLGGKLDYT